jgi:hydroxymethylbilane synthase
VRSDVEVVELSGNVDTRLRKLASGECDALVLAMAGLARLGRADAVDGVLDELVPAAGQGALALEARIGGVPVDGLADPDATACVLAERELTRALGASCNTPVGAYARRMLGTGGEVELLAWVGRADGSAWISDRLCGAPSGLGARVAERLLTAGAAELLS